jgi:hypothetical protein
MRVPASRPAGATTLASSTACNKSPAPAVSEHISIGTKRLVTVYDRRGS